jgi:hypothetical protein
MRWILSFLLVLGLGLAPLGMGALAAEAAAPAGAHQMPAMKDCGDRPGKHERSLTTGDSCCIAMCVAIAAAQSAMASPPSFKRLARRPGVALSPESYLAELPTPPPRRS